MISTGTDIKPLECLLFMRDIRSRVYFEQAKGRGTRTISDTDFNAVTPDASHKTHFVIVDAVGVCERDKTDSRPLERKKTIPFDTLINNIALGIRDPDTMISLAGRLARLDREIEDKEKSQVKEAAGGISLKQLINGLMDAVDPDKQIDKAKEIFQTDEPTDQQVMDSIKVLVKEACTPFDNPDLRNTIIDIKKRSEQIIDTVSKDVVFFAGFDEKAKEKARTVVDTFKKFIEDNKYEITALQIIYSQPFSKRHLTYKEIEQLAMAIEKPPYKLTKELLWHAYEQLEKSKVKGAGPQRLLTDMISLVHFAIGKSTVLQPFTETVNERFSVWIAGQEQLGKKFTPVQIEWLAMIKDHIATSLTIDIEDFELAPFYEKGGLAKVYKLFGEDLNGILKELNEVLAA